MSSEQPYIHPFGVRPGATQWRLMLSETAAKPITFDTEAEAEAALAVAMHYAEGGDAFREIREQAHEEGHDDAREMYEPPPLSVVVTYEWRAALEQALGDAIAYRTNSGEGADDEEDEAVADKYRELAAELKLDI